MKHCFVLFVNLTLIHGLRYAMLSSSPPLWRKYPLSREYFKRSMQRIGQSNSVYDRLKDAEKQYSENKREKQEVNEYLKRQLKKLRLKEKFNAQIPPAYAKKAVREENKNEDDDVLFSPGWDDDVTDEELSQLQDELFRSFQYEKESGKNWRHGHNQPHSVGKAFLPSVSNVSSASNVAKPPSSSEHFEFMSAKECARFSFDSIGGYEDVKDQMKQCQDFMMSPEKYRKFNVRLPKGIVLYGPPGTGKTLFAKAMAGQTNASFIAVSGSEFQEKYVGVGAARVRELFQLASENQPCCVFIDEMDSLGRQRSSPGEEGGSASRERDGTLNELLVQLDGVRTTNHQVLVICATNRMDLLDPALVRPGRMDKKILIGLPDEAARKEIVKIHLSGKSFDTSSVSAEELVDVCDGFSGADIENFLNECMLRAIRNDRQSFNKNDVDHIEQIQMGGYMAGQTKRGHSDAFDEHQFLMAVHEIGHCLVGLADLKSSALTPFSPRAGGHTRFHVPMERIYSEEFIRERVSILLAGRIAEEIIFGRKSTGADNDLTEARHMVDSMLLTSGMGSSIVAMDRSEAFRQLLDQEAVTIVNECYKDALWKLKQFEDAIEPCAHLLLRKSKIVRQEIVDLLTDMKFVV